MDGLRNFDNNFFFPEMEVIQQIFRKLSNLIFLTRNNRSGLVHDYSRIPRCLSCIIADYTLELLEIMDHLRQKKQYHQSNCITCGDISECVQLSDHLTLCENMHLEVTLWWRYESLAQEVTLTMTRDGLEQLKDYEENWKKIGREADWNFAVLDLMAFLDPRQQ
jgi:hypothetical protein